jgi:hypothetical protein
MNRKTLQLGLCMFAFAVGAAAQTVTGSGTTNDVPVFTGSSTVGNSPIAVSGNNVGIGIGNPLESLEVDYSTAGILLTIRTYWRPMPYSTLTLRSFRRVKLPWGKL